MNKITKLILEIGLFKELYEQKIITEQEMSIAIQEINKELEKESEEE